MLHLHHEWHPLTGQIVEIRFKGKPVRYGRVDVVTDDDQVLWICHDGAEHRRLFDKAEGFEVWSNYSVESKSRRQREANPRFRANTLTRPGQPSTPPIRN